jgi:hypothetical protein
MEQEKIYFAGSIRGGRADAQIYYQIIEYLKNYGHVFTEHIGDKDLHPHGEIQHSVNYIHDRDLAWILQSDSMVAEVTTTSLGVGYEIGRGVENHKKILCLYRPQEGKLLSGMLLGCPDITVREYQNIDEAKKIIDDFFK